MWAIWFRKWNWTLMRRNPRWWCSVDVWEVPLLLSHASDSLIWSTAFGHRAAFSVSVIQTLVCTNDICVWLPNTCIIHKHCSSFQNISTAFREIFSITDHHNVPSRCRLLYKMSPNWSRLETELALHNCSIYAKRMISLIHLTQPHSTRQFSRGSPATSMLSSKGFYFPFCLLCHLLTTRILFLVLQLPRHSEHMQWLASRTWSTDSFCAVGELCLRQ